MVCGIIGTAVISGDQTLCSPVFALDFGVHIPLFVIDFFVPGALGKPFFKIPKPTAAHIAFRCLLVLVHVVQDLHDIRRYVRFSLVSFVFKTEVIEQAQGQHKDEEVLEVFVHLQVKLKKKLTVFKGELFILLNLCN